MCRPTHCAWRFDEGCCWPTQYKQADADADKMDPPLLTVLFPSGPRGVCTPPPPCKPYSINFGIFTSATLHRLFTCHNFFNCFTQVSNRIFLYEILKINLLSRTEPWLKMPFKLKTSRKFRSFKSSVTFYIYILIQ